MTTYTTRGTCSRRIDVELEGGTIKYVKFYGGCNGNLNGISKLVTGMRAEDVIERMRGVTCGAKGTSCPDQLSKALEQALSEEK